MLLDEEFIEMEKISIHLERFSINKHVFPESHFFFKAISVHAYIVVADLIVYLLPLVFFVQLKASVNQK